MSDNLLSVLYEEKTEEVLTHLTTLKNKVEEINEKQAQMLTKQPEIIINKHDGLYKEVQSESFAYYQTLGFDTCIVLNDEVFLLTKNLTLTIELAKEFFTLYAIEGKEKCSIFYDGYDVLVTRDYNF